MNYDRESYNSWEFLQIIERRLFYGYDTLRH